MTRALGPIQSPGGHGAASAGRIRLGIIGYPLGYSLSPLLHNAVFEKLAGQGIRGSYAEYPVPAEALETWLTEQLPRLGLAGFNVTIPHKEAVFEWCKRRGSFKFPEEEWIGAINAVKVVEDGRLEAYNTDARGFLNALRRVELKGQRVLLLGAGGSARAAAFALIWHARVGELIFWNRHRARAELLASDMQRLCGQGAGRKCNIRVVDQVKESDLEKAALLVNTVPVSGELLVEPENLAPGLAVYDLVYHPPWTALLKAAQRRHAAVISGLEMLVNQAALSFEIWVNDVRGVNVHAVMMEALREKIGEEWPR
ncbi:MAG: shikimate dehydrogenase [Candidatus Omnitrophica bacterium]|nr:shikimate dehydrogenase [Candidatus Omnitrophota bacterium]